MEPHLVSMEEIKAYLKSVEKEQKIREKQRKEGVSQNGHDSSEEAHEIDLEALHKGEVRVPASFRHDTVLRYTRRLFEQGLEQAHVWMYLMNRIETCFDGSEKFLEKGDRHAEVVDAFEYVRSSYLADKALEASELVTRMAVVQEDFNKKNTLNSGFKYEFSGALSLNRYSHEAVVGRVLQRFGDGIENVDGNIYAFNDAERMWIWQRGEDNSELGKYVDSCLVDMVTEKGFVNKFTNKKGVLDTRKFENEIEHTFRANNTKSVVGLLKNHILVKKSEFKDFDAKEHLIYCNSGVLNVRSLEIREAKASDKLLNKVSVNWNPESLCPKFIAFIDSVFAVDLDDPEGDDEGSEVMVPFMQMLFGYSLTGSIAASKVFCHYGDGANGKSMMFKALEGISGSYKSSLGPKDITNRKGQFEEAFERVTVKTRGKRVIIVNDFDVKTTWNDAALKCFTEDSFQSRKLYQEHEEIPNRAKFHFAMNKVPEPQIESDGLSRRLCIIPYTNKFEHSEESYRRIKNIFLEEREGIFRWAVLGAQKWYETGFIYPEKTKVALEEYKKQNYPVESWIKQNFRVPENGEDFKELTSSELVKMFEEDMQKRGKFFEPIESKMFGRKFKAALKCSRYSSRRSGDSKEPKKIYRVVLLNRTSLCPSDEIYN